VSKDWDFKAQFSEVDCLFDVDAMVEFGKFCLAAPRDLPFEYVVTLVIAALCAVIDAAAPDEIVGDALVSESISRFVAEYAVQNGTMN